MPDALISHEPATSIELWRGTAGDVDAEVAVARAAWSGWAAQPLGFRSETLRRFANVVRQRSEALADTCARETGKPLWEARAEVEAVIARVDICIRAYGERTAQRRIDAPLGARLAVRHKPHGVVAVIAPFPSPLLLPAGRILPALLAGNAVVFKPSEQVPASATALTECFHAAGLPPECLRLLIGGSAEGKALAAHPDVDAVLFTGSARSGLALARSLAARPETLLATELGGNNPIVVWDTPDLHSAAVLVVQSAFAGAGQHCMAARRLIVEQRLAEPLLAAVNALIGRLIIGAPHDSPAPFMGPVRDNATADALTESFLELLMRGGRALRHPERRDDHLPFLTPALIDVTGIAERPDIELFGPILQVVRVDSFDAAIAEANATRFGLAASLISQTPALYDRFWAGTRAGIVNWNRPTIAAAASAPAGGTGWSGNHRPGSWYEADNCAYPVTSNEAESARASIGIGLRDG
ncbi:succinylglutamate-semialdehyde dehydrogenase [Sphingomonas bacterium]|uniref:succinylglutamate-semialdehyde dehydrogenase n=1 Tax=Sphingomonas bacterium TaxID=1895847 RepID=UPI0015758B59|nr:succinylglutamate-semialdehyde dehydrogenase [Sphingomonas bacterium]